MPGLKRDLARAWTILQTEGILGLRSRLRIGSYLRLLRESFGSRPWNERLSGNDVHRLQQLCRNHVRFSLIVDARHTRVAHIRECLNSIRAQNWPDWQVVIFALPERHSELQSIADDHRMSVVATNNTMSLAEVWNAGTEQTNGQWIGQVPADARLTPDALTWLLVSCNRWPEIACVYSDSVSLDHRRRCVSSCFKPDFSLAYLLSSHFTGNLAVFNRLCVQRLRGLRQEFHSAARYDLELRLVEEFGNDSVRHLDRAVCLERPRDESRAVVDSDAQCAAAVESLRHRRVPATVQPHPVASDSPVNRIELAPQRFPHVTIYVATRNAANLVRNCVRSIRQRTCYPNYDIVVIDNQSDDEELLAWLGEESAAGRLSTYDYNRPFNHSEMHNLAIAESASEFVVLMNNDIEITSPSWLEQLVATAQLDASVGSVGALLLYPDQTVQHAGILIGHREIAGHYHRGLHVTEAGYNGRLHCMQELTACTAALLLIRRSAFTEVGGFDADNLPTSYNDVDLGLRLRQAGYQCIYNPAVQAIHFESKSRRFDWNCEQLYREHMLARWSSELPHDPFHNRNHSLVSDCFGVFRTNRPDTDAIAAELNVRRRHTSQRAA